MRGRHSAPRSRRLRSFPWLVLSSVLLSSLLSACPASHEVVDAGARSDTPEHRCRLMPDPAACLRQEAARAGDAGTPAASDAPARPRDALFDVRGFRFVRLRAPTAAGGEEIVRIGLNERARSVDGLLEEKTAPSPQALAALVKLCGRAVVTDAIAETKERGTAPSMTVVELACGRDFGLELGLDHAHRRDGLIACEAARSSTATCALVDEWRAAIDGAWRETAPHDPPLAGVTLLVTRWSSSEGTATVDDVASRRGVLRLNGKALLPAKGDRPLARAPNGKRVELCVGDAVVHCAELTPPSVVHVDVVPQHDFVRFRCPTCVPSANPSARGKRGPVKPSWTISPDGQTARDP